MEDLYIEKDKTNSPFLLAASFAGLIKFVKSYAENNIVYWQFTPKQKAQILVDQLRTKTEPHIPAKDLFEAIETFWRQVAKARNGEMNYGRRQP